MTMKCLICGNKILAATRPLDEIACTDCRVAGIGKEVEIPDEADVKTFAQFVIGGERASSLANARGVTRQAIYLIRDRVEQYLTAVAEAIGGEYTRPQKTNYSVNLGGLCVDEPTAKWIKMEMDERGETQSEVLRRAIRFYFEQTA